MTMQYRTLQKELNFANNKLRAAERKVVEQQARIEALEKAAKTYMGVHGHSAYCWLHRTMDDGVTQRNCVCGHDALAALLQEPTK